MILLSLPSKDVPVDSEEGIGIMMDWARAHGFVLSQAHERIAKKYGVSVEGVFISGPLPEGDNARPAD